jgi:hypothetical protein
LNHLYIAEICLIYLLDFNGGEQAFYIDHDEFPLLPYAALHWIDYLTHGPTKSLNAAAVSELDNVLHLLTRLFD